MVTPSWRRNLNHYASPLRRFCPTEFSSSRAVQKIGKSWLSLDLCQAVATGGSLWDFQAEHGDVLYLALEDNYNRLQNRLKQIEAEKLDISRLHMATASFGLQDGLLEQIHNFVAANPSTNLVAIDTLEHIRNGEQTSYKATSFPATYSFRPSSPASRSTSA